MEITKLEQMTKEEVFNFIRKRLSFGPEIKKQLKHVDEDDFSKEHRRFEMSGCEQTTGWCTLFNTAILNEFANLRLYLLSFSRFRQRYSNCLPQVLR